MQLREFSVANEFRYDLRSPLRWVIAHVFRYPWLPTIFILTTAAMAAAQSAGAVYIGRAFDALAQQRGLEALTQEALLVAAAYFGYGAFDIVNSLALRILGQRVERDARDELYLSLLGKSQTFLSRQRVGDLMARATGDVQLVSNMIAPNAGLILESLLALLVPFVTIAWLYPDLLLVPTIFLFTFLFALQRYSAALNPVANRLRERYGMFTSQVAETIGGIEVVKGFAQEPQAERQVTTTASEFRDWFIREGRIQARYLPFLLYGLALGAGLGHALWLVLQGRITLGQAIAFMTLIETLRTPIWFSLTTFAAVQQGLVGARRLLELITARGDLDQNQAGYSAPMRGELRVEAVDFSYATNQSANPSLRGISFSANPGETIAIVGQTGAGKTTLAKLINRTFDPTTGRVLIDGLDLREWNLESLRSQIGLIEQDIFLFSRSIADNIAFGAPVGTTREQVEQAARQAQAYEFIIAMPEGFDTVIGERGVTLSGGQRQRIAIARAFLSDPRILIIDDSTSAVDSATEDAIQHAMREILQGRTTILITHRLAQIRRADRVLVLRNGTLAAQGRHTELLDTSPLYRSIFVEE